MRKVPEFNENTHKGKAKDKSGTTYKIKLQTLKRFSFQVLLIMHVFFLSFFFLKKRVTTRKMQQTNFNISNTSLLKKKKIKETLLKKEHRKKVIDFPGRCND